MINYIICFLLLFVLINHYFNLINWFFYCKCKKLNVINILQVIPYKSKNREHMKSNHLNIKNKGVNTHQLMKNVETNQIEF